MKKALTSMFFATFAASVFAVDGIWSGPENGATWGNAANWSEAGGAAAAYPATAEDTADFPAPVAYSNIVSVGNSLSGSAFAVGKITGTDRTTLNLYTGDGTDTKPSPYADYDYQANWRFCDLYDVSGFLGWWRTSATRAALRVHPADGEETFLANVDTMNRLAVSVPEGKARIGIAGGSGILHKVGAGELAVDFIPENDGGRATLKEGTLTLTGSSDSVDEAAPVLAGAYLHLDATVSNSLQTTVETFMGRTLTVVTNWSDCRGAAAPAGVPHAKRPLGSRISDSYISAAMARCPFLTNVNGLDMVDFGATSTANVESLGPTNCVMSITPAVTKAREVFCVMQRTDSSRASQFAALGGSDYNTEGAALGEGHYYDLTSDASHLIGASANASARFGDIAINGVRRIWQSSVKLLPVTRNGSGDVHVFSVGSSVSNLAFVILGSDRYLRAHTGGGRIGEIIVFTNALTRLERARVNRYLLRKWRPNDASLGVDLGTLIARADSVKVSVPEGRTASIRDVAVVGTKLVKSGAGCLEVGNLQPASAKVNVQGGSISYRRRAAAVDDSAIAANPSVHLDAMSDDGRFVFVQEGGTNFVSQWKDDRTTSSKVATTDSSCAHSPFIVENVGPGQRLRAVSFGAGTASGSFMNVNENVTTYEGFIACKVDMDNCGAIFGSDQGSFLRDINTGEGRKMLLYARNGVIRGVPISALWTVNGVPRDPVENVGITWSTSDFYVFSFSADSPLAANMLGRGRPVSWGASDKEGSITVGEFITYDRRLDDAERRNTIAYLMKKWLGQDHPEKTPPATLPDTVYAADVPVVFDVGADVAAGGVSGGDGSLVKRGAGALTMSRMGDADFTSISVEEGVLSVDEVVFSDDSLFHFDASADSFVTDSEGVTRWNDVRGNGVYASYNRTGMTQAKPRLVDFEMPDGVSRRVVDFGAVRSQNMTTASDAASLDFSTRFTNVKEAHVVFMQNDNWAVDRPPIFTDTTAIHYNRGGWNGNALKEGTSLDAVYYGRGWTNGYEFALAKDVVVANNAFRLYSFAPTNVSTIGTICRDRGGISGGAKIAEMIGFSKHLSDDRRDYLMASLMNKWFGSSAPTATVWLDSLSVADGAALEIGGTTTISTPALTGAGTISAAAVVGVGELTLDGPMTIEGEFEMASSGTVTLRSGFDLRSAGLKLLVSSTGFGEVDLSQWSLNFTGTLKPGYGISLRRVGNSLYAEVTRPGMTVILR